MRTFIKRRSENTTLVVMFGGWGNDEHMFLPLCRDDHDFILFYNYSADEALILPELKTYTKVYLLGWSLGVWAAEYMSEKTGIKADLNIALNGTPNPAHDKYGLPIESFYETLEKVTPENMEDFYSRLFGNKKNYILNRDRVPHRDIKSLHDELRWIYNRVMEPRDRGFHWDHVVICEKDKVFPTRNLKKYWAGHPDTTISMVKLPHYPFNKWGSFMEMIKQIEKTQIKNGTKG